MPWMRADSSRFLMFVFALAVHIAIFSLPWQRRLERGINREIVSRVLLIERDREPAPVAAPRDMTVDFPPLSIELPAPTPITLPTPERSTDWQAEASRSVRDVMARDAEESARRSFDETDRRQRLPLDTRGASPREFRWTRESTQRMGLTPEGLFFVRLSEHCMLVLAFIGCAFGPAPPPAGDLFEGMGDPDEPTSSVPEVNDAGIEGLDAR